MELFGIELFKDFFDGEGFAKLIFKFGINFIFLAIIVRLIYYRIKDDKDYVFTFFMFNVLTLRVFLFFPG